MSRDVIFAAVHFVGSGVDAVVFHDRMPTSVQHEMVFRIFHRYPGSFDCTIIFKSMATASDSHASLMVFRRTGMYHMTRINRHTNRTTKNRD